MTVADIDRWNAESVREVFHAAGARGTATLEASQQLSSLAVFDTWEGATAEARKHSNASIRQDLDAHGNESLVVAKAAGKAANDIEHVQSELRALRADAAELHMTIDAVNNKVVPDSSFNGPPMEALIVEMQLQPRLVKILAEANSVDAELTAAINMADGDVPVPAAPHDNRPEIQQALSQPLPTDPKQLHDLWDKLTPEEKDWLYSQNHNIGNHNGMASTDRDHYNRLNLADELSSATASSARADALKAQHPDWAQGHNIPSPNEPGAIFDDRLAYEVWQHQYDAAREESKYLPDLQAVSRSVQASPDRKLMLLDTQTGKQARAAIAVGDPDTATHVSVTAPGLNTTVHGAIEGMASESTNARTEALRQLGLTPGHANDTVSAIAWIGCDPPQVPGFDQPGASLAGGWGVSHDDIARAGAHDLAGFYDGIQAAHHNGPADLTAIGHSYGSLTTGLALQEPGDHGVSRALFYGSPGIEASAPQQLHLEPGHVFTMETSDDPIQWVYDGPPIAHAVAPALPPPFNILAEDALAGADASSAGHFGPNPATNPNFTHLATAPSVISDGHGGTLNLRGAHGHSDYPRFPDGGGLRTTNYNIAAVLAGLDNQAVPQR
jgi:alpha/beta hydrolase family protein